MGRGVKLDSENYVRECTLRAISDDYEEFERIFRDATQCASGRVKSISRSATQKALEELIRDGYAQAYNLSADGSPALPVTYLPSDLSKLWFYVTASGKKLAEELGKNWN